MAWVPLDIERIKRGTSGRLVGAEVFYHASLDSAMDVARRLAELGTLEGAVVIAEEQTAGRGRFSRAWVSPAGQNILMAVVMRPAPEHLRYVNMAATLAVSDALTEVAGLDSTVKWPNDVRVGGRKVAGILVESSFDAGRLRYATVGIGVNVNFDPSQHADVASMATSLKLETGRHVDRNEVLLALLLHLDDLYGEVKDGTSLTDRWSQRLDTLGRTVNVRWGDRLLIGTATGVDEEGNLLVTQPDGTRVPVMAGEVTLQE